MRHISTMAYRRLKMVHLLSRKHKYSLINHPTSQKSIRYSDCISLFANLQHWMSLRPCVHHQVPHQRHGVLHLQRPRIFHQMLLFLMIIDKRIKEKNQHLILLHAGIWQKVKHQGLWPIPNVHLCAWQAHMHLQGAIT